MMPAISVIVPVYKVEPYLPRCINSILDQTFTDFELILVDDGSPDNCGKICDEFAAKDNRIRVIHQENGGLSAARNAGIQIALGEYLMFCDSDDYVSRKWCEYLYLAIKNHNEEMAICNVQKYFDTPQILSEETLCNRYLNSYYEMYVMGLSGYVVNKIFRRDVIERINLRFDEKCRYGEDVDFVVKYFQNCSKIYYINRTLYYYSQVDGSILHRYYPDLFSKELHIFKARLPVLSPLEISDYCDIWLYLFIKYLNNTWDKRNKLSIIKKFKYNNKMMHTDEFKYCVQHAAGKKDSKLYLRILKTQNYYLLFVLQQVHKLKELSMKKD